MMCAELDAVICSGPRRGNQFTYALLEERVPRAPTLGRDEGIGALARRYFTSRGPATVRDYPPADGRARPRKKPIAAPSPPTNSSDEISQATPPATPPPITPRTSDGAPPKIARATCPTMNAASNANGQPPRHRVRVGSSAIGAGSGSPLTSSAMAAVASDKPPA